MAQDRDRFDRERYDRDRYDRDQPDRGALARAGDEVRSWFGDDDARRRRERDERYGERGYGTDPQFGERDYRRDRDERWTRDRDDRWTAEPAPSETYRDFSDRYGRSYRSPIDRDRTSPGASRYGSYPGSQEFGTEGYGAAGRYGSTGAYGREWTSTERWRVPGPYVGRGPKGYQRSDERIREDVSERLTAHGLIDASDVEVRVQGSEVTLIGFVDSREAKRAAEDCAEDVSGVREVHNQLRIRSHADDVGAGRTSVLGLTEKETQTTDVARRADAPTTSRARNT